MAGVYLFAREFDLSLTASVLQGFFGYINRGGGDISEDCVIF
jgi:hypothetical protein